MDELRLILQHNELKAGLLSSQVYRDTQANDSAADDRAVDFHRVTGN
jgi:hypothetical protein